MLLTACYIGSYYAMIDGVGQKIRVISASSDVMRVAPRQTVPHQAAPRQAAPYQKYPSSMFPLYRIESRMVEAFYRPAHDFDREIRKDYWIW